MNLTRKWGFDCVHEAGIKALERLNLGPARNLQLARIHDIRQWIKPELGKLASRNIENLTLEEAKQIGIDFTTILYNLRNESLAYVLYRESSDRQWCRSHNVRFCGKCQKLMEESRLCIDAKRLLDREIERINWPTI